MEVEKKEEIKENIGTDSGRKFWLGTYIIVALSFLTVYILLITGVIDPFVGTSKRWMEKLAIAGFLSVLLLAFAKLLEILILRRQDTRYRRYNFVRLTRLLSVIAVAFLVVSFLFSNWYSAAVSLGLISLILGFALQSPISSLIAWVYILIRNPYRIGDRIQIGEFKGDVVEIGYLDTTLWEVGGLYLSTDLPSGRLIRFPNSLVLQDGVYNYSWQNFEFIWNEIPFYVAYESDLAHIEKVVHRIIREELGEEMTSQITQLKNLVKGSPIDQEIIRAYPLVSFRTNANTWIEVLVTYLVPPKKAAMLRSSIIKRMLKELAAQPDQVMFPKSNMR
jgi:small-conductance mechanosensitive channel